MIGRVPSSARDLFDQGGLFSRLQHSVSQRMHQLASNAPPAPVPSCAYTSMFYRPHATSPTAKTLEADDAIVVSTSSPSTPTASALDNSELVVTGLDGISLLIASFLDGRSLGRMQIVNKTWSGFITLHHEQLFCALAQREFEFVIASSTSFKTYLFSLRHELDRELSHCQHIQRTHAALEQYCTEIEPHNHGFVAMFCDIVRFRDARIARFVAHRRNGALNMVLTATPAHVQAFRRACPSAGPIAFVPFDNPHWPQFELPRVEFPGFLGYAFDHVEMVKGYEALKGTVVKSILRELMIFETPESAAAYGVAVGKPPFAAIIGGGTAGEGPPTPNNHLTFSNPLREELRHLSIKERIEELLRRIAAVDHSLTKCSTLPQ